MTLNLFDYNVALSILIMSWAIFGGLNAIIFAKLNDEITTADFALALLLGPAGLPGAIGLLIYYKPVMIWKKKTPEQIEAIKAEKEKKKLEKKSKSKKK